MINIRSRYLVVVLAALMLGAAQLLLIQPSALGAASSTASPTQASPQSDLSTAPLGICLESYDYPYPTHLFPVNVNGAPEQMSYMDVLPTGQSNGQAVVLLHGKNMGGYYWNNTIKVLSEHGFRVIVPDQVGWGKSSKPQSGYSFDWLAANTQRLLDSLGISKAAIIGHSTGGMLAVRYARTYPEHVSRLILEDPIGLEDYRRKIPPQSDETLFQADLASTDPKLIRAFFDHYFATPHPELSLPLAQVVIRVTKSADWIRWAKASASAYQMIYQQPVCYEYDLLEPPTLIIVGQRDHTVIMAKYGAPSVVKTMGNFPELAKEMSGKIAKGSFLVVPNCGHIPHLEQPSVFHEAVLNFLK